MNPVPGSMPPDPPQYPQQHGAPPDPPPYAGQYGAPQYRQQYGDPQYPQQYGGPPYPPQYGGPQYPGQYGWNRWTPPPRKKSRALRVFLITIASLLAAGLAGIMVLVGQYHKGNERFEDLQAGGALNRTVNAQLNAIADSPPDDTTDEQWEALWNEPELNTPDAQELMELIGQGWEERLKADEAEQRRVAGSIADASKRSRALESVDLLQQAVESGLERSGRRYIYSDLAPMFTAACYGRATEDMQFDSAGNPMPDTSSVVATIYAVWSDHPDKQRIVELTEMVYPDAFEAGLQHYCDDPYPPLTAENASDEDHTHADAVAEDVDRIFDTLKRHPDDSGYMSAEDYESFWEEPALTTPEAQDYLERLGERATADYQEWIAQNQGEVDQIEDDELRAHTQAYLDGLSAKMEEDGSSALGIDDFYQDITQFWSDTCSAESALNIGGFTRVDFSLITKNPEPKFNSATIKSADAGNYEPGDEEWSEESLELALKVYPGAYEAGVERYCG